MTSNELFEKIGYRLKIANRVLIASHENPDPDAVGSVLALYSAILRLGKEAVCYLPDEPSPSLGFLPNFSDIKTSLPSPDFDLIFCLDYGDFRRLRLPYEFSEDKIITFDHHLGEQKGLFQIINPQASATAEIVYDFLRILDVKIDSGLANCLLAGIVSDSGLFSYSCTSSKSMKVAADLISKGASQNKVIRFAFTAKLKIWGQVLENSRLDSLKSLAYSWFSYRQLENRDYAREAIYQLSEVPSLLARVSSAKIGLLLTEYEDGMIRGNLRSNSGFRVDNIAKALGGGGHPYAAGFRMEGALSDVLKKVQEMIK